MSRRRAWRFAGALAVAFAAASAVRAPRAAADPPAAPTDAEAEVRRRVDVGAGTDDPDFVRAWARETAEAGRARPGTALGGDLLTAAAGALLARGLDAARALEWTRAAIETYPAGSAGLGLAWLHAANAHGWLEDPAAVLGALASAEAAAKRGVPASAPVRERLTMDDVRRRLDEVAPLHRARALTALARHAEAADVYEALAVRGARGGLHAAGRMWREAALSAWRAGDKERAQIAGRRALDVAGTDDEVVDRTTWNLLAAYGLLDGAGEMRLANAWPGPAFAAAARSAARSVEGRRGAWRLPLLVAGVAMVSREHDEALALYEAAFLDPSFAEEARTSAFYRQTIVTAAHVALQAKRPRDALRWLQTAERWAGGPIPDTTLLRAQIDERLAEEETRAPDAERPPGATEGEARTASRPGRDGVVPGSERSRLGSPAASDGTSSPAREAVPPPRGDEEARALRAAASAAAVVVGSVLLAVLLTRRRRPPR